MSVGQKDLLELSGIFGELLSDALDIIDHEKISIFKRKRDQREYIEIIEDQNTVFKLLPNINYCMCPKFRQKVIAAKEVYTCKHVLAAKLALLIRKFKVETPIDDAFSFSIQLIKPQTTITLEE